MKIVAFSRYGDRAASTRQRFLQYAPALSSAGMELEVHPLLDDAYMLAVSRGRRPSRSSVARAYIRRLADLSSLIDTADIVWVYAELFPYLPASFERLASVRGKPVVYDFDDAFFLSYELSPHALVRRILGRKFEPMLARSAAVFCGNRYIRDYATRFAPRTALLPTVVDTDRYRPALTTARDKVVVGWVGSPSTWRYVEPIIPVLRRAADRLDIEVRVVGAGAGTANDAHAFAGLRRVEWVQSNEISDIQAMDIGIMPVVDEPWALGKCGYKLIQYMACGLPVIATPIGAANDIVDHGINGFLAGTDADWEAALETLVTDRTLRATMGARGRARVEADYSLRAHAPHLIAEFRGIVAGNRPG